MTSPDTNNPSFEGFAHIADFVKRPTWDQLIESHLSMGRADDERSRFLLNLCALDRDTSVDDESKVLKRIVNIRNKISNGAALNPDEEGLIEYLETPRKAPLKSASESTTNVYDNDGDGLSAHEECLHGSSDDDLDTNWDDGDCLTDGALVNVHGTDPLIVDTDSDGFRDGCDYNAEPLKTEKLL